MSEAPALVGRELRAMNSDITLVSGAPGAERRIDRAARWLAAYEERYSRFRLLSELSRLNAAGGRPFRVSPGLYDLVALSLGFARRSDGLFDPTVLGELLAAGYDRSFELIAPARPRVGEARARRATWRDVALDASTRTITLPPGSGIDLGGIGKGWAVDRLALILGTPSLANGGGDVRLAGAPPDGPAWRVGVSDPFHPDDDLCVLQVADAGVATSSSLKRRWQAGDVWLHHLIDPRTGRPSQSDAVQVTVVAPVAVLADFHAKVTLLLGVAAGQRYLDADPKIEGLIVSSDGEVVRSAGLSRYL